MGSENISDKKVVKNKAQTLSESHWIVKGNALNEIRNNIMSVAQQRFFVIYLSKINPRDPDSRLVRFKLSEYIRIMQFKQMNITRLEETAAGLLKLISKFKEPGGGFMMCQIFKQFKLYKESNDEWYVSINCHDDVLPYLFEFEKHFFRYQLWNTLRLSSSNQIRMYEILKQYERAGAREISIADLRDFIGIAPDEYSLWQNFKVRILDSCQLALAENTDIRFSYEPIKKGRGGKITALKFFIEKNTNYVDPLTLDEFLDIQDDLLLDSNIKELDINGNEYLELLSEACDGEFSEEQIQIIWSLLIDLVPVGTSAAASLNDLSRFDYVRQRYYELKYRASRKDLPPLKSRFGYFKELMKKSIEEDKRKH